MTTTTTHEVPDYEPLRAWALSPVSSPPPGWRHLLRGGIATWVRQTPAVPAAAPIEPSPPPGVWLVAAPLTRLVAAMIAQVYP
ncbi:MAG: hypothetical protein ACLQUY_07840 [Ktedonobacterales bacterium]